MAGTRKGELPLPPDFAADAPVVILLVDRDRTVRYFNRPEYGFVPRELIGAPVLEHVPEEHRPTVSGALDRVFAGEEGVSYDTAVRTPSGEEVYLRTMVGSIREGSEVRFASLIAFDITSEREARLALQQSEQRFRLVVEHSPDAITILDADSGFFIDVNRKAVEFFGFSREELLTKGPVDVSPPFQAGGVRSVEVAPKVIAAALAGEEQVFEWLHQRADGEIRECEIRLLLLPHAERRWVRGSITDITSRKAAERENERLSAQLAQAQKMQAVGQLTGGVAHDFNNLLTVIGSSLTMLELDSGDPERARELIELGRQACDRATELTQRLLAFSRQTPLSPRRVDLAELIRDMEGLLRRTLGEDIRIETELVPDLWRCEVDPAQLENALLNLALNARDAMPEGGRLSIEASNLRLRPGDVLQEEDACEPGDYVRLAVHDDGEGIPPAILPKVFEPFFTTKEVGKGSGLGLSMVYGFIKQSGGHVRIDSEVGQGTSVGLFLPRSDGHVEPRPPAAPRSVDRVGHGERILVVEDEAILRRLITDLLQRIGFDPIVAEDGPAALALLDEEAKEPALLLTDVVLPGGMDGAEVARQIGERFPGIPVLFMSGYTGAALVHEGRLDEGVELLQKPFDMRTLAEAVLRALALAAD